MIKGRDTLSLRPTSDANERQSLLNERELTPQDESSGSNEGISVMIAAIYVTGLVAGSGMIALPKVVFGAGWFGIISLPVLVSIGFFTALTLAKCWNIICINYPEYREHIRHPYVVISYVAFGQNGRRMMHVFSILMFFAVSLVILLLICDNIRLVTMQWFDISFCSWLPIVILIVYPIVLLKTPVETQFFAVISLLSSVTTLCLILAQIVHDGAQVEDNLRESRPAVTFSSVSIALSTIGFAIVGHACFPTYQNSMIQPMKFNRSLTIGFIGILIVLCSPAYTSYYFLGGAVYTLESDNLLNVLSDGVIKSFAGTILAIHFMMAYVFVLNPLCQQIEELAGVPDRFSWQLVLIRSILLAAQLFLAESVPQFGPLLAVVGAFLWIPSAYIAPSVFFLRLRHLMKTRHYVADSIALHVVTIILATMIVCCCMYASLTAFTGAQSTFSVPCYVNSTAAHI